MATDKALLPNKPSREQDFYAWCVDEANKLRVRQPAFLDWAGLAEELDEMSSSIKHALTSHLARILEHLLKLAYEPSPIERANRGRGWKADLAKHRDDAADILGDSRTLRNQGNEFVAIAYPRARRYAGTDMANLVDRWRSVFPIECPWSMDEILDHDFYPETLSAPDGQSS
jgi:Domain of unknown function DUF29